MRVVLLLQTGGLVAAFAMDAVECLVGQQGALAAEDYATRHAHIRHTICNHEYTINSNSSIFLVTIWLCNEQFKFKFESYGQVDFGLPWEENY